MDLDESIVQLAAKLDEWFDSNATTFASQDRVAQGSALLRGFEIVKGLDRLKKDGMAAITALVDGPQSQGENERAASLMRAFEFAARLADTLHDELLDTDGENKIWALMDAVVRSLDKIGRGRAALDVLLDHPDARVRGAAGAYLIDLMPERVIPVLREVEEKEDANSAHFNAAWTLLAWERQRTSRFNSLGRGTQASSK